MLRKLCELHHRLEKSFGGPDIGSEFEEQATQVEVIGEKVTSFWETRSQVGNVESGVDVSGNVVLSSRIPLSGASLLLIFGCLTALLRCERSR
jgi:hypothetical protein